MNTRQTLLNKREELRSLDAKRKAEGLSEEEAKHFEALVDEVRSLQQELQVEELFLEKRANYAPQEDPSAEVLRRSVEAIESRTAATIELRGAEPPFAGTKQADISKVTPALIQELMRPMHENFILGSIGGRIMTNVHGEPIFPTMSAVDAQFAGEAVALTDKKVSITALQSKPQRIGVTIPVSNRSIVMSNVDLPREILNALGESVLRLFHKWVFSGEAVSGATDSVMKPVLDAAGTYTTAAGLTFKDLVGLEEKVLSKNFVPQMSRGAYIMGTKAFCALKSTPIEKYNPRMILEGNMVNGYPVVVSNFIKSDAVLFGCWEYLATIQFGTPRLVIDPVSEAIKDVTRYTLNTEIDAKLLVPEAFAAIKAQG